MKITKEKLTPTELKEMSGRIFGNMVKAVVDVERGLLAVDAELHSDLEALLIQEGSKQANLWGINLYPEAPGADLVEFDSMINLRPSQGNRSRGVESQDTRQRVLAVVQKWVRS